MASAMTHEELEREVKALRNQVNQLFAILKDRPKEQWLDKVRYWRRQTGTFSRCPHDEPCDSRTQCDKQIARDLGLRS